MRRSYTGIDGMKFIAAILVTAIHILPFEDMDPNLSCYFTNVICRIGVPFFFACSGFFLADKIEDAQRVKGYLLRLVQLYGIWTLLYLPQIIYQDWKKGYGAAEIVVDIVYSFFVTGSYTQFWYFPALFLSVVILYFLKGKCKCRDRVAAPLMLLAYVIGVMGNAYCGFLIQYQPMLARGYEELFTRLDTHMLGGCFGLFYVYAGYLVKKYDRINNYSKGERIWYGLAFVGSMLLMLLERKWLLETTQYTMGDMTFAMIPATYFLVKICIGIDMAEAWSGIGMWLRQSSTIVFCAHLFVNFYLHKLISVIGLGHLMEFSLYRFLFTYAGTLVFAGVVIGLSKRKFFDWLRKIY